MSLIRFNQSLLALLCVSAFLNIAAGQTAKTEKAISQTFQSHPALQHATIGIEITDIHSDQILISYNADKTMIPASVQKLLITATALEEFSPTHTFTTRLEYSGFIDDNGMLHGDIYITGGGDPALGSKAFSAHYGNVIKKIC